MGSEMCIRDSEMGDNLIGWMEVYASYALEYNLLGADNKDPENGELKK